MHYGSLQACALRSHSQRGQAALFVVLVIAVGIGLFAYGAASSLSFSQQQEVRTRLALTMARDALIGRAASDDTRPGSLPCPDINNDGVLTLGVDYVSGGDCVSLIGRLPWRTLGLPDLRDPSGESLWYVLSTRFRDVSAAEPINSDTKGNITVHQDSTASTITTEAVAVIFAPGSVLAGQIRDSANANNAVNYLDTTGGVNNAIAAGPFISAQANSTFNDRVLVITTAELMPVVEMRVARELRALLEAYRANSTCGCYPWADWTIPWTGEGDNDALRGALSLNPGDPELWGSGSIPPLPAWLLNNQWWRVIYYAVDPSKTETPTAGTLTVNANPYDVVLIMTGPAGSGPLGNLRPSFDWTHYVDDTLNSDGNNAFVTPSSTANARDRLYTIP